MSLILPAPRQSRIEQNFSARPFSGWGTSVTASATPHSEGTVTELVTSTTDNSDFVIIDVWNTSTSATNTASLLNIYTGASMTHLIIPNLMVGWAADLSVGGGRTYGFPLRIPRGTRIGASLRAVIASDVAKVGIQLFNTGGWSGGKCESVGEDTANSRGTSVTPGTTSDGTLTTLGTTGFNWKWCYATTMGNTDTTLNAGCMSVELGVGGSVLPMTQMDFQHDNGSEFHVVTRPFGKLCSVASGTTVQGRCRTSAVAEARYMMAWGIA